MRYKRIFVDAAVYSFAGYLIQPLAIVSSLMVKGAIGPYLTGVMATLNLILYYASFTHLGVLNAAERDLPVCLGSGDTDRFNRIRDTTFFTSLFLALLFAVGMVAWALWSKSDLDRPMRRLPIGKGEVLREGESVCLIGIGNMVQHALANRLIIFQRA